MHFFDTLQTFRFKNCFSISNQEKVEGPWPATSIVMLLLQQILLCCRPLCVQLPAESFCSSLRAQQMIHLQIYFLPCPYVYKTENRDRRVSLSKANLHP